MERAVTFHPTPGHAYDVEYRIHHKDGSLRWVYEKGRVMIDQESGDPHLVGTLFDITARKKKDADYRSLTTALQNAVEGIAFIDKNLTY